MQPLDPEILDALKAILFMVSVLVALVFLGLFKGRWFFLVPLLLCLSSSASGAGYTVFVWVVGGQVVKSYVPSPGDTVEGILAKVWGVHSGESVLGRCPYYMLTPTGHLSIGGSSTLYNGGLTIFGTSTFSLNVKVCPTCTGLPGVSATKYDRIVDESVIPKSVFDESLKGPQTDIYGATRQSQIHYDGTTPNGYSVSSTPPPGVTPIRDELGNITGYMEGGFNERGEWEYLAGYAQPSTETMTALYQSFLDWFRKWKTQDSLLQPTLDDFSVYMAASLQRGSTIEDAILALNPATGADVASASAEIVAAIQGMTVGGGSVTPADVQAASADIVAAVQAISPGSGGDPGTVEVDLAPVVDALAEVKASIDSLQEQVELPQYSVESLAIDDVPMPDDAIAISDYYTSWNVSLPGLLGDSVNFSLGFLFGSVPSIGSQTTLTLPTLTLPFCEPLTPTFSLPEGVDLSLIRSVFLFALLIGFAFAAYRILSSGMNI